MREIQLRDAKARLSEVVDEAVAGDPAVITRHGRKTAVILSWEEYQRAGKPPSLGWLLANSPIEEGDLPERRPAREMSDLGS